MNKRQLIALVILIISVVVYLITQKKMNVIPSNGRLKVTTSFYPLAYLAETIGGAQVTVTNLTPPGAEPHDYEPNTQDIARLTTQDVLIFNGGGLEAYTDKIKANIDPAKTTFLVVGAPFMTNPKDPHVWLDPVLYQKEARLIADAFIQKDPAHRTLYTERLQALSQQLDNLNAKFIMGLHSCSQKNIITSHQAFGYLAQRYGLTQIALAGLSPDQEPSPQTLADVAAFAKAHAIRYIFFEALVSPQIADTVAQEIGARTLVFNPLEGLTKQEVAAGKTYLTVQEDNLKNLQIALSCTTQ